MASCGCQKKIWSKKVAASGLSTQGEQLHKTTDHIFEGIKAPVSYEWLTRTVEMCTGILEGVEVESLEEKDRGAYRVVQLAKPFFQGTITALEMISDMDKRVVKYEPDTSTVFREYQNGNENGDAEVLLGEGMFAEVFRVQQGDHTFAMKVPKVPETGDAYSDVLLDREEKKALKASFVREFQRTLLLSPDGNIMRPLHVGSGGDGEVAIIYPEALGTVRRCMASGLTQEKVHAICQTTLQALLELQHHPLGPIVHRGIRPENILEFEGGDFKLALSGFSSMAGEVLRKPMMCWKAPEYLDAVVADSSLDVWEFGTMLLEVLTGKTFDGIAFDTLQEQEQVSTFIAEYFEETSESLARLDPTGSFQKIVFDCLKVVRGDRPTAEVLLKCLPDVVAASGASGAASGGGKG